jgi:hypothetical protein
MKVSIVDDKIYDRETNKSTKRNVITNAAGWPTAETLLSPRVSDARLQQTW